MRFPFDKEELSMLRPMLKRPVLLKKYDKIGIVAPSRVVLAAQMERAFGVFKEWEVDVICGEHLFAQQGYFAGSDDQRRSDLQKMINDPDISAIFCARGGYGMTRIIDQLDIRPLAEHPKWIIGFSDITALHLALNKLGLESIHGHMPVQFGYAGVEESLESLHGFLFEGNVKYAVASHEMNRSGEAEAPVIGGNLSLVAESLGTPTEIDTAGKILFLEEIDEYLYKIDRMLIQLKRAGKLDNLSGVVIGDFSQMKDTQIPFGKSIYELIDSHIGVGSFPVAYGFPAGHEAKNLAIPFGRTVRLEVAKEGVVLTTMY